MKKLVLFFSVFLVLFSLTISQSCSCKNQNESPPQEFMLNPTFSLQKEVIGEIDYGVPVIISNIIVLNKAFQVERSLNSMKNICPQGYELLNENDITAISQSPDNYDTLLDFGIKADQNVFSNTKSFPDKSDGSDNDAWKYKAIYLEKADKLMTIKDVNTYFVNENGFVLCKAKTAVSFSMSAFDYAIGTNYSFEVPSVNAKSVLWKIDSQVKTGKQTTASFSSLGCKIVQVWAQNAVDSVGYNCKEFFVIDPLGSDGSISGLTETDITLKEYDKKVVTQKSIFFNRPNTSIATTRDGNMLVLYSNSDNNLNYAEIDSSMNLKQSMILENNALPMDIIETPFGFVIYAKKADDEDHSFIAGYNRDGSRRFLTTIMNNGELPTSAKSDQIIFHDNKGEPLFGINAMYSAHNGKLAYGRERIALVFAHYNHFGYKDGKRDDHTGDTFITFNNEGGDVDYGWAWLTSHSLVQSIIYDGQYFVTASLGDVFPENITVCFVKPRDYNLSVKDGKTGLNRKLKNKCNNELVPGKIPGNGGGDSCGLQGGLTQIQNEYLLVYSRKACEINAYDGGKTSDSTGEIGFVKFKFENEEFTAIKSFNIADATNVIGIRSQKYGDKLLILLSITDTPAQEGKSNPKYYTKSDKMRVLLVDMAGKIISDFNYTGKFSVPLSQDLRFSKDGSVVWSSVDRDNNNLLVSRTKAPEFKDPYLYAKLNTSTGVDLPIIDNNNNNEGVDVVDDKKDDSVNKLVYSLLLVFLVILI